jgi:hypothetical protein
MLGKYKLAQLSLNPPCSLTSILELKDAIQQVQKIN